MHQERKILCWRFASTPGSALAGLNRKDKSRAGLVSTGRGFCPSSCPSAPAPEPPATTADMNPLLAESTLPYHLPPFDRIKDEHYAPAFAAALASHLSEVDAIANNPAPPTFENTIVALDKSGLLLARLNALFSNLAGANTNPTLQKIEEDIAPKLAAHTDAIFLNAALYARVKAVYDQRDKLTLDPESTWLLERYHLDFVRGGANLSDAVSTGTAYVVPATGERRFTVAALDLGIKANTPRMMSERGIETHVLPASATIDDVMAVGADPAGPDGLFFSNGPGDPAATTGHVELLREALRRGIPYFGICFGNQLFGRALGLGTYKLKYGHRGINQPVMDRTTGKVEVTAHNHGFAVDAPLEG